MTSSPYHECCCAAGVLKESCSEELYEADSGRDICSVVLEYCNDKFTCDSDCVGDVTPDYQQERPHTGDQHLGLYLDCDDRSLTVLDCDNNHIIFTVNELNLSCPLVPCVYFEGGESVSARLVAPDSVILPQVLCDMLNATYRWNSDLDLGFIIIFI